MEHNLPWMKSNAAPDFRSFIIYLRKNLFTQYYYDQLFARNNSVYLVFHNIQRQTVAPHIYYTKFSSHRIRLRVEHSSNLLRFSLSKLELESHS